MMARNRDPATGHGRARTARYPTARPRPSRGPASGQDRSCSRQADGQLSPTANAAPRPRHCAAWSKRATELITWTDSRPYSRHQRPTRVDMQGIGTTTATGGRTSTQLSGRGISDRKGTSVRVAAHFLRPRVFPLKNSFPWSVLFGQSARPFGRPRR